MTEKTKELSAQQEENLAAEQQQDKSSAMEQSESTVTVADEKSATDTKTLLEELERIREALKKANREAAERRKLLEQYEEEKRKYEAAKLSEMERLQRQLAEEQARRIELERLATERLIRYRVELAANQLGFNDPADAWAMLDLSSVAVDDTGNVTGVEELLKELAERKPYLLRQREFSSINAENGRGKVSRKQSDELRLRQLFGL